ncbi:hypothetical protein FRB91_011977 [Serendipita sp. 411]|nr:hypothetical protein FRB91_011977 [Serendipita sp. 411]
MNASQSDPFVAQIASRTTSSTAPEHSVTTNIDLSQEPMLSPSNTHLPASSWTDQPPTQSGQMRSRVFVACQTCRSRKTKCDGLKPVCTNCIKREFAPGPAFQHLLPENEKYKLANGVCLYDQLPKRRGPDRTPGARVRKKTRDEAHEEEKIPRRRRRNLNEDSSNVPVDAGTQHLGPSAPSRPDPTPLTLLVDVANQQQPADTAPDGTPTQSTYPPSLPYSSSRDDLSSWLSGGSQPPPPSLHSGRTVDTSSGSSDSVRRALPRSAPENPDRLSLTGDHAASYQGWEISPNPRPPHRDVPHLSRSSIHPQSVASSASLNFETEPRISRRRLGSSSQPTSSHFTEPEGYYNDHSRYVEPVSSSSEVYNQSYEYLPSSGAYIQLLDENNNEEARLHDEIVLPLVPDSAFVRKTWFDSLLDMYASLEMPADHQQISFNATAINPYSPVGYPSEDRSRARIGISHDLRILFTRSSWWFSFIHLPTFWANLHSPHIRDTQVQPGLVLSVLALAAYFKSSELEGGAWERERASRLRDEAEAAVEGSLAVGWIDMGLAQAAWFLAMYECCPHSYHTLHKARSAITRVDNVLRLLKCSYVDADNPMATRFDKRATPLPLPGSQFSSYLQHPETSTISAINHGVYDHYSSYPSSIVTQPGPPQAAVSTTVGSLTYATPLQGTLSQDFQQSNIPQTPKTKGCNCNAYALGECSPEARRHTPLWHYTAAWSNEHEPGEIQREETRRLIWHYVTLISAWANHTSVLGTDGAPDKYWSACAENYAVLFPGESTYQRSLLAGTPQNHDLKQSVWALYSRAQLLWLACLRMRHAPGPADMIPYSTVDPNELSGYSLPSGQPEALRITVSSAEMAAFSKHAWLQAQEIEDALNTHTCNLERAFIFHGREYLSNIRMVVTHEFSRYVPIPNSGTNSLFNRLQADDWLQHQSVVCQRIVQGMQHVTGIQSSTLAHRPFFVWWFMASVMRLLNIWETNPSMTGALQLTFGFLPAIDYLTALWPCENQRNKYLAIRKRLDDACRQSGLPPPSPPDLNVTRHRPQ